MTREANETVGEAMMHAVNLMGALNLAMRWPDKTNDTDREYIALHLRRLNQACTPLLRPSVVTVRPSNGPGRAA